MAFILAKPVLPVTSVVITNQRTVTVPQGRQMYATITLTFSNGVKIVYATSSQVGAGPSPVNGVSKNAQYYTASGQAAQTESTRVLMTPAASGQPGKWDVTATDPSGGIHKLTNVFYKPVAPSPFAGISDLHSGVTKSLQLRGAI